MYFVNILVYLFSDFYKQMRKACVEGYFLINYNLHTKQIYNKLNKDKIRLNFLNLQLLLRHIEIVEQFIYINMIIIYLF